MPFPTTAVVDALEQDALCSASVGEGDQEAPVAAQVSAAPGAEGEEASGVRSAGGSDALAASTCDGEARMADGAQDVIGSTAAGEDGKVSPAAEQEASAPGVEGGEARGGPIGGSGGSLVGEEGDGKPPLASQDVDMSGGDADASNATADELGEDLAAAGAAQDVQCANDAQPGEDEVTVVEATHAGPRKLSLRNALRAKAAKEIEEGNHEAAIERLRARLLTHDERIKEKEGLEVVAQSKAEEVNKELQAATDEVAIAVQAETEACKALRPIEQRHREAAAKAAALRDELQKRKDALVLLEMRVAKRRADEQEVALKRRKIEELEQVLADSRRAAEEIRQREQEAKEAMKRLLKEEKHLQLTRLGRFTRRYRQRMLTCGSEGADAAAEDAAGPTAEAGEAAATPADASGVGAPVRVKREVVAPALARPNDDVPVMVVVIDDDSQ